MCDPEMSLLIEFSKHFPLSIGRGLTVVNRGGTQKLLSW